MKMAMLHDSLISQLKDKVWDIKAPRISNRRLLLTYNSLVEEHIITSLLNDINSGKCTDIIVEHQHIGDIVITQVAVDFGRILTNKQRNCMSLFDVNGIIPRIRVIATKYHWDDTLSYLRLIHKSHHNVNDEHLYDDIYSAILRKRLKRVYWYTNEDIDNQIPGFIEYMNKRGSNIMLTENVDDNNLLSRMYAKLSEGYNCDIVIIHIRSNHISDSLIELINSVRTGIPITHGNVEIRFLVEKMIILTDSIPDVNLDNKTNRIINHVDIGLS